MLGKTLRCSKKKRNYEIMNKHISFRAKGGDYSIAALFYKKADELTLMK